MSHGFTLKLRQEEDFRFVVEFDHPELEPLLVDEPPPVGRGSGPNPTRLLGAAVASCLSASLLFCLRKAHIEPRDITSTVDVTVERDDRNRLRIGTIRVGIHPTLGEEDAARASRCKELFEDFCIVTQSVRRGIDVDVNVQPVVNGEETTEELVGMEG